MGSITGIRICHSMLEDDLKQIIDTAYKYDSALMCKPFDKNVTKYFHGFRDLRNISDQVKKNSIFINSRSNELFAVGILMAWFMANDELEEKIIADLKAHGYEPLQPDFFNLFVETLDAKDCLQVSNKCFFKAAGYENMSHHELLNSTLMAVLLGWWPSNMGEEFLESETLLVNKAIIEDPYKTEHQGITEYRYITEPQHLTELQQISELKYITELQLKNEILTNGETKVNKEVTSTAQEFPEAKIEIPGNPETFNNSSAAAEPEEVSKAQANAIAENAISELPVCADIEVLEDAKGLTDAKGLNDAKDLRDAKDLNDKKGLDGKQGLDDKQSLCDEAQAADLNDAAGESVVSIEEQLHQLEIRLRAYNDLKKQTHDLITRRLKEIDKDIFGSFENITGAYKSLNEMHSELESGMQRIDSKIKDVLNNYAESFTGTELQETNHFGGTRLLTEQFKYLKENYTSCIEYFGSICSSKVEKANGLLKNMSPEFMEIMNARIQKLQEKVFPSGLLNLIPASNELNEIIDIINLEISRYDLTMAREDLLKGNNIRKAANYIYDYVCKNGEPEDIYIFLVLFSNHEYELYEEYLPSAFSALNCLAEKYGSQYIISLAKTFSCYKVFFSNRSWKTFMILVSLYIYLKKESYTAAEILFTESCSEVLINKRELYRFAKKIMLQEPVEFVESTGGDEAIQKVKQELENYFRKENNKFINVCPGIDFKHQILESTEIMPVLYNEYLELEHAETGTIEKVLNRINKETYATDLLKQALHKADLKENLMAEKKLIRAIDKTRACISSYGKLLTEYIGNNGNGKINISILKNELDSLIKEFPQFEAIISILTKEINQKSFELPEGLTEAESPTDAECLLYKFILQSSFMALHSPETVYLVNSSKITKDEIYQAFIEKLSSEYEPKKCYMDALENYCFEAAGKIGYIFSYDRAALEQAEMQVQQEISGLNAGIINRSKYEADISALIWSGRNKLILAELNSIKETEAKLSQLSNQQQLDHLGEISKNAAQIRLELYDEKHMYNPDTLSCIFTGLSLIEMTYLKKEINKLKACEKIIDEIQHLCKFRDDTTETLLRLINECNSNILPEIKLKNSIFELSLSDILKYVTDDNYTALGLNQKQWNEISHDRKDDIIVLLEAWLYLCDKALDLETVKMDRTNREHIEGDFTELYLSLARICSLYRTNDKGHIGQEPFSDWETSPGLPFTFCTKIQQPRCESLNQQIRIFSINDSNIKKHLSHIRDYILDNNLDNNSFSVLLVLCSRKKFDQLNTFKLTNNLPILDEAYLKKIIFNVYTRKKPKWEFAFLLTLNKDITTIHPFRTQGSINSDIGIFVGRSDIIQEIISNSKDYAIYGGRRIGKSSLLNEIKRELEKRGYITTYQSLMSNPDSIQIANSILFELKAGGCKTDRKIPIEHLEDFKGYMKEIYLSNPIRKIAVLFDEVDELIKKEKESGRHLLIEMCRDLSNETEHHFKFIFAGFKEMYQEIHKKGIYEKKNSPWRNFVEDTSKRLAEIESPRELIDEGLSNILGLEYDEEVVNLIEKYSSGHPAFLQMFCTQLITSISNWITPYNRKIYPQDVHRVFSQETEFIKFVYDTLDSNLSKIQSAIIFIAASEKQMEFSGSWIYDKLHDYVGLYEPDLVIFDDKLNLELELLEITGVVKYINKRDIYRFTHEYYIEIINQLERIDRNVLENLISDIIENERLLRDGTI